MTATILDTETGKTRDIEGLSDYDLTDGNWSCDCNRGPVDDSDTCKGCKRYLVVAVSPKQGTPIRDYNADYPKELLQKYL